MVLGSESCDLDSVVSSLAMAYFLSRVRAEGWWFESCSTNNTQRTFNGQRKLVCLRWDNSEVTQCDLTVTSPEPLSLSLSQTSSGLSGSSLVLPVLNIPRSQFHLQADILLLLRESGITTESLVFRDQVDLARLHGERRLVLTLVDHSVLQRSEPSQQSLSYMNILRSF